MDTLHQKMFKWFKEGISALARGEMSRIYPVIHFIAMVVRIIPVQVSECSGHCLLPGARTHNTGTFLSQRGVIEMLWLGPEVVSNNTRDIIMSSPYLSPSVQIVIVSSAVTRMLAH